MNESNEIHRDIYVGMVAEEMAQSGYYGEDVTLYGFLANGELNSFDDEQECAETYLLALAAGAEISRMTSMHKRCQKKRSARKPLAKNSPAKCAQCSLLNQRHLHDALSICALFLIIPKASPNHAAASRKPPSSAL